MSEIGDSGSAVETAEASLGSAGGETDIEPGEGKPGVSTAPDRYDLGGPKVEAFIAETQKLQAGTEVANSGGSSKAGATGGAKAGGDSKASGDGKAGAGQDASADSIAEASGGSAGEETVAEPGDGEPAVPPASDGYYIGGSEVEKDIAKTQKLQADGGGGNGNENGSKHPPELQTAERPSDQPGNSGWDAVDAGSRPPLESLRITPERSAHILDGDAFSGGHRHGTGKPGKTEFPASWADEKILGNSLDVAQRPDSPPVYQHWNDRWLCTGTRDGVEVSVIVQRSGEVWTSWPEEGGPGVMRNPKRGTS
jgi:hypothetical protein